MACALNGELPQPINNERVGSLAIRRFFQPCVTFYCCISVLVASIGFVPRIYAQAPARVPTQAPPAHAPSAQAPPVQEYTSETGVEQTQQLFATVCALDAAGFNADENTLPGRLRGLLHAGGF